MQVAKLIICPVMVLKRLNKLWNLLMNLSLVLMERL